MQRNSHRKGCDAFDHGTFLNIRGAFFAKAPLISTQTTFVGRLDMYAGRRARLQKLGFTETEAEELSALHTRNFM
ncbi:MAG: hypothetical protein JST85_26425 [Acidobacteria bacterium]|nr:hypothetical protein [Acidobacteriota bacterium]